jgi:hypothetical protein
MGLTLIGMFNFPTFLEIYTASIYQESNISLKEYLGHPRHHEKILLISGTREYPGAPDIPGIPAGSADDGINYLILLYYIKAKLPSDKSLSIAVPASYWYLKAFPVESLWLIVDYFVFMT